MASSDSEPPRQLPNVPPPQDLYQTSDIRFVMIELGKVGVPGEWSIAPGGDTARVLLFFHGGGYCSGSILSHRRMVTEAGRAAGTRTLAVG